MLSKIFLPSGGKKVIVLKLKDSENIKTKKDKSPGFQLGVFVFSTSKR
jgi:hypothetical protein